VSDINGTGYGSDHAWKHIRDGSSYSVYSCRNCPATFTHFYDATPNIFKAIEAAGVPKSCPPNDDAKAAECVAAFKPLADAAQAVLDAAEIRRLREAMEAAATRLHDEVRRTDKQGDFYHSDCVSSEFADDVAFDLQAALAPSSPGTDAKGGAA
jgi:hypothetical protein